ncbi:hypothetical protein DXG03_007219 [Asterophora parasitica]|uniref:Mitochondrial escape protein 2 n=1 Tax=Asterophora parasitica TaxID=117018 RepID=A0A9P7GD00_9AGAR|nr:hypothetical protein DXG03_007219 [Asterophora parasitica]
MISRTRLTKLSTTRRPLCRSLAPPLPPKQVRRYSDSPSTSNLTASLSKSTESREGWLFVDSVFPIQIARWDLRHYIGILREEHLLGALRARLDSVKTYDFQVLSLEPHQKDGGVFVRFSYSASDPVAALKTIESQLTEEAEKHGGLPSWIGLTRGGVWLVKGTPWREDMNRYASPNVKVVFEGPDVHEQSLYQLFRVCLHVVRVDIELTNPYGRIQDVAPPVPIPGGNLRASTIAFYRLHSATIARNVVHGLNVSPSVGGGPHVDNSKFRLYKWLRIHTLDRLSQNFQSNTEVPPAEEVWRERGEVVGLIKSYLSDMPCKSKKALIIDCRSLQNAASDSQVVSELATQTGYWPVFTFLNSMNNLIDLASVGVIGQKAGLSSSLNDQLQQILVVVGTALKGVISSHRAATKRQLKHQEHEQERKEAEEQRRDQIRRGTWHDGRLDCVAGNGIMSELGIGDELMLEGDGLVPHITNVDEKLKNNSAARKHHRSKEDMDAVVALPIVVIRNYGAKAGSGREELLTVLAQWAATLAESQTAHVIVISDNRENSQYLAKALPSKPLTAIALSDADPRSSISFVIQKLHDADIQTDFTPAQTACVERLGGRASDLESLIHKVRNGQKVEEAVEDIIIRGVGELRRNAFGDDIDDAKNLPWTREQAWAVLKLLSKRGEAPYHDVLLEFPFKGDETALRSMEHAELISIGTHDGRASTIRPGKPVFRWVFERLVQDPIFSATQDIALNEKAIAGAEKNISSYEEELTTLQGIAVMETRPWWHFGLGRPSATAIRSRYLAEKMIVSERKVETLERKNRELKKVLAKGG